MAAIEQGFTPDKQDCKTILEHRKVLTMAEIKEKLGLDGDVVVEFNLWSGQSPADIEENGYQFEKHEFEIVTKEYEVK